MFKAISGFKQYLLCSGLLFLFLSSTSYAEIFKWVDENGQTHYADKMVIKVEELKIRYSPNPIAASTSSIFNWQEKQLKFQQRLAQGQVEQQERSPTVNKPEKV